MKTLKLSSNMLTIPINRETGLCDGPETVTVNSDEIAVEPNETGDRLTVRIENGWDDCKKICKKILTYNGRKYKFIGWNSDTNEVYFIQTTDFATVGRK